MTHTAARVLTDSGVEAGGSGPLFIQGLDCSGVESTLLECGVFYTSVGSACELTQGFSLSCEGTYVHMPTALEA